MGEEDQSLNIPWEVCNDVLCYLQVQKDRLPRDDLIKVMNDHYNNDQVKLAFPISAPRPMGSSLDRGLGTRRK